jgi:hypothetical protein
MYFESSQCGYFGESPETVCSARRSGRRGPRDTVMTNAPYCWQIKRICWVHAEETEAHGATYSRPFPLFGQVYISRYE